MLTSKPIHPDVDRQNLPPPDVRDLARQQDAQTLRSHALHLRDLARTMTQALETQQLDEAETAAAIASLTAYQARLNSAIRAWADAQTR